MKRYPIFFIFLLNVIAPALGQTNSTADVPGSVRWTAGKGVSIGDKLIGTGISLTKKKKKTVISRIKESSPASNCSITINGKSEGVEIVRIINEYRGIDLRPTKKTSLNEVYDALSGKTGTYVTIEYKVKKQLKTCKIEHVYTGGFNLQSQEEMEFLQTWYKNNVAPDKETKDRDNDGITDDMDACPDEAGYAAYKGCINKPLVNGKPDFDVDGIPDDEDQCPDKIGKPENHGCPVENNILPDQDGDGLPDIEDNCPVEKGLKENNGCPVATAAVAISKNEPNIDEAMFCNNLNNLIKDFANGFKNEMKEPIVGKSDDVPSAPPIWRYAVKSALPAMKSQFLFSSGNDSTFQFIAMGESDSDKDLAIAKYKYIGKIIEQCKYTSGSLNATESNQTDMSETIFTFKNPNTMYAPFRMKLRVEKVSGNENIAFRYMLEIYSALEK